MRDHSFDISLEARASVPSLWSRWPVYKPNSLTQINVETSDGPPVRNQVTSVLVPILGPWVLWGSCRAGRDPSYHSCWERKEVRSSACWAILINLEQLKFHCPLQWIFCVAPLTLQSVLLIRKYGKWGNPPLSKPHWTWWLLEEGAGLVLSEPAKKEPCGKQWPQQNLLQTSTSPDWGP